VAAGWHPLLEPAVPVEEGGAGLYDEGGGGHVFLQRGWRLEVGGWIVHRLSPIV
jgi:hypothetical protein